jgi:hypothetical protein
VFPGETLRLSSISLLLIVLLANAACGGGGTVSPSGSSLSGNWEISLQRHVLPDSPLIYSGFLQQSGGAITGSVILGSNCSGVGPITGTLDGQKLALTINEFGQEVSLTGAPPSSATSMGGEFSTLAGGCTPFPNTGTWSAIRVPPLAGAFHGTFKSSSDTIEVGGTLSQGPNTGNSNATITGTLNATGAARFCSYLTMSAVAGVISGTTLALNLYGPDGMLISQIPGSITPDASSFTGTFAFQSISKSCLGDQGTVQLTFP